MKYTVDLLNKDFSRFSLEIFLEFRAFAFGVGYLPEFNKIHVQFGLLSFVLTFPVDNFPDASGLRPPVIRVKGSATRC